MGVLGPSGEEEIWGGVAEAIAYLRFTRWQQRSAISCFTELLQLLVLRGLVVLLKQFFFMYHLAAI